MRMMTIKSTVTIEDTPWSNPVDSTPEFYVYIDKFPVTEGHTLFVPVHLIPRRENDMEDPRGGVRHVIPDKGNYKK